MWHTIPAVLFFTITLMFFFALEAGDPASDTASTRTHTTDKTAPALDTTSLYADKPVPPLAMVRGTPVLINFFASWCTPCLAEHPLMHTLGKRHDVMIYGIGWGDEADNIRDFLIQHGNPYDHVAMDEDGRTAIAYGLTGVPESYLLSPDHRIAYHLKGPITEDRMQDDIIPLLESFHD